MYFIFILTTITVYLIGYFIGRFDKERTGLKNNNEQYSFQLRRVFALFLFVLLVFAAKAIQNQIPEKFDVGAMANFIVSGLVVIGLLYSILTFEYTVNKNKEDKRIIECQGSFNILSQWYVPPLSDYARTIYIFEGTEEYNILQEDPDKFQDFSILEPLKVLNFVMQRMGFLIFSR